MNNNINVQLYSSCNCSCNFCNFTDTKHCKINPEFVINYLKNNPHITKILLTGGEPTLAIDEYAEIIRDINTQNKNVILQTNGWWGDNENIKAILKQYPPTLVHLSVDYEKQKFIPIETVINAYTFLIQNKIEVAIVNHHIYDEEFEYYKTIFPKVINGRICIDDGINLHDCGTALLANNTIGKLNIKGWCSNG